MSLLDNNTQVKYCKKKGVWGRGELLESEVDR